MVGRHGLEVLLEATLVLEGDFIRNGLDQDFITTSLAFAHRALGKAGLLGEPQNPSPIYLGLDAGGLLTSLMTQEHPWTDAPIIELLMGRFGTRFRDSVALSMVDGIASDAFIGSFVRTCISRGRIELLHAVADLGMPDALKNYEAANRSKEATGPGGQWLDVLANHSQRGAHPAHRTTFAAQIGAFSKSAIAKDLADILVKHDLGHLGIEAMRGTLGHAIVIESMLRSRLEHTSASTNLHAAVAPAARARRATL